MAQLPSRDWLIQQIGYEVILFQRFTEEEIVRFDPSDADATARAQGIIAIDTRLDKEDTAFAHFWSGYFHAHATGV
jgi:hypothetical protein